MPALFNTVSSGTPNELRFYNYISNRFYGGVPTGLINIEYPLNSRTINDWLINYAFPANTATLISSVQTYFYFPNVTGTPTQNESCTGTVNNTNNFRFSVYNNQLSIQAHNNGATIINTQNSGTAATQISQLLEGVRVANNTDVSGSYNYFMFGVKSATTLVLYAYRSTKNLGGKPTEYDFYSTLVVGWLHNGIFPTPFTDPLHRYNNCFYYSQRALNTSVSINSTYGGTARQTGLTTIFDLNRHHYYEIACQGGGSYISGSRLLHDFPVWENDSSLGFRFRGTIDNRVVCAGRGDFKVGEIYRAENIFGRTGVEDWLCVCPRVPASLAYTTWTPGMGNAYLRGGGWKPNEYDYMLVRLYTEAD